jgi:nitrile hydratase accessory protein
LFQPDDPLSPPQPAFDEPWQAQALALADSLVKAGHFSAQDWAQMLGAALAAAEARGAADTLETYYLAVVEALENLSTQQAGISRQDMDQRRAAWEAAYHRTPHGQPVVLEPVVQEPVIRE